MLPSQQKKKKIIIIIITEGLSFTFEEILIL
jgi:hypothetical protein